MNKYLLAAGFVAISTDAFCTPLSSSDWNTFYSSTRSSCISNQSNYVMNYGISIGEINAFCSCYARNVTNSMSYETLNYITNTGDNSQLITIANNATSYCVN